MTTLARWVRFGLLSILFALMPLLASAAPYAALVMDARTGEVLYSSNADTRLHPASLTKMMTLYIAFEAIEKGEISLDSMVTVSARAAGEQPSRLGLRAGQKIALRYLIRAAAIKSANDAATAIAEAIGGSVPGFAERMNRTARALGMKNSTFKNANGLTESGHLSTARDLTILGRRLFYDYPEYYNLFSRRSADAGVSQVSSTNARFLDAYDGADGIKTGYTSAAGFNLTASAERGGKRIIATLLGGTSTAQRNAKMAELLDLGFAKAPARVREVRPAPPAYPAPAPATAQTSTGAKTVRVSGLVQSSPRPLPRPVSGPVQEPLAVASVPPAPAFVQSEAPQPETLSLAAVPLPAPRPEAAPVEAAPAAGPVFAQSEPPQPETLHMAAEAATAEPAAQGASPLAMAPPMDTDDPASATAELAAPADPAAPPALALALATDAAPVASPLALASSPRPQPAPGRAAPAVVALAESLIPPTAPVAAAPSPVAAAPTTPAAQPELAFAASAAAQPETLLLATAPTTPAAAPAPEPAPAPRPDGLILTSLAPPAPVPQAIPEVITRVSSSGGERWGVSLGIFGTSYQAERVLLQTALMEAETLGEALRKVANRRGGFDATFVGMPQELAEMACRRLAARQLACTVIGP